jgi:myb proto-oncogene protein
LDPSIDRSSGRTCKWTADEDSKLQAAVQTHSGKNWVAIAALVWRQVLDPSIDQVTGRIGKWSKDESIKLKNAVEMHGGKNWDAVAALIPGRTKRQCWNRWKDVLDPSIDQVTGRAGKWGEDEDIKLKEAGQTYGGQKWNSMAALVTGRLKTLL